MPSRYSTNLHREPSGNKLLEGEDLTVTIAGDPVYVIGRLFERHLFRKKLIQIEQTGHKRNPSKNSITFEMVENKGGVIHPMPPGKYRVTAYAYFKGLGGKRWGDNFEIDTH